MKLIGKLKDMVEKAETKGEAKEIIKNAGMILTDEELNQVTGGGESNRTILIINPIKRLNPA